MGDSTDTSTPSKKRPKIFGPNSGSKSKKSKEDKSRKLVQSKLNFDDFAGKPGTNESADKSNSGSQYSDMPYFDFSKPNIMGVSKIGKSSINKSLLAVPEKTEKEVHTYTLSGVTVKFPFKAYPSQVAMMGKIVQSLQKSQNAMLESPTGSGKSLALLCAALGWREYEKERIILQRKKDQEEKAKRRAENEASRMKLEGKSKYFDEVQKIDTTEEARNTESEPTNNSKSLEQDSDDDFLPDTIRKSPLKSKKSDPASATRTMEQIRIEYEHVDGATAPKDDMIEEATSTALRLPKIYFGSRTHKQLSQIIKELKQNTTYRPRMAVLGSRNHLCINERVQKSNNKNEDCQTAVNTGSCKHYNGARLLKSHKYFRRNGPLEIWDIEDLTSLGKKQQGCPFYTSRAFAEEADIIFCPYNYLIDPAIRTSLNINIDNNVIILDEAHNIEDAARDASKFEVTEKELEAMKREMNDLVTNGDPNFLNEYRTFLHLSDAVITWILSNSQIFKIKEFDRSLNLWKGSDIKAFLEAISINEYTLPILQSQLVKCEQASSDQRSADRNQDPLSQLYPVMSQFSLRVFEGILRTAKNMLRKDKDYLNDFCMVLIKRRQRNPARENPYIDAPATQSSNNFNDWVYRLGFWCMNPGVAFDSLTKAKSVVLTSGTLSPMDTFSSELQSAFPIKLEANHVIESRQIWVSVLPSGPNNTELNGTYKFTETLQYQDQIGQSLLQIVQRVPHGVLVFMPSYSMMDKLMTRWKLTGLYSELSSYKTILLEPQASSKDVFEGVMNEFYDVINESKRKEQEEGDASGGALFFGVYRGKVSEGIDFADEMARAVVNIGIPFPSVKDVQVQLKRDYNDKHSRTERKLLTGGQWYEIQAYRAINQALGRCIRSKKDWGAIILLDNRFIQPRTVTKLSKWVRNQVQQYPSFDVAMNSLSEFVEDMKLFDGEFKDKNSARQIKGNSVLSSGMSQGYRNGKYQSKSYGRTSSNPISSNSAASQSHHGLQGGQNGRIGQAQTKVSMISSPPTSKGFTPIPSMYSSNYQSQVPNVVQKSTAGISTTSSLSSFHKSASTNSPSATKAVASFPAKYTTSSRIPTPLIIEEKGPAFEQLPTEGINGPTFPPTQYAESNEEQSYQSQTPPKSSHATSTSPRYNTTMISQSVSSGIGLTSPKFKFKKELILPTGNELKNAENRM